MSSKLMRMIRLLDSNEMLLRTESQHATLLWHGWWIRL